MPIPLSASVEPFELDKQKLSFSKSSFVSEEIFRLLAFDSIELCATKPDYISPTGCVPKKKP